MELDTIISVLGFIVLVLTNVIAITYTYGKLVGRIAHIELDIISLKHSDELHSEELKILHQIEGQLKVLIPLLQNKEK